MFNVDVDKIFNFDYIIIDIRYKYDYDNGHIVNAIWIPFYELKRNFAHYLNYSKSYCLYCDTGDRSNELVSYLRNFNYNIYNLNGGYNSYLKYIDRF